MLDSTQPRRGRSHSSRSAHQTKAERCNKMESELLRQRIRLLDGEVRRYSDCVYKEKRQVSRQLEQTRQTSGHCPLALMPEGKRDLTMISKTRWFKESQGRLSEKQLQRWRNTESELDRIYNVHFDRKEEMTQQEKNRRLALVHFLRTSGLLDKKTKDVLLPFVNNLPSNSSSDSEEDETTGLDEHVEGVDRIRLHFPRVFDYCKEDARRLRSAPGGWLAGGSRRSRLKEQLEDVDVTRRVSTANNANDQRTFCAKPQRTEIRSRGSRGTGSRFTVFSGSLPEDAIDDESSRRTQRFDTFDSEATDQTLGEDGDASMAGSFSHLPQWKRDLLIEAPMFVHSTSTESGPESVKAVMSKTQIRRDLEEMQNENTRRSRYLHAFNLKKVYLQ